MDTDGLRDYMSKFGELKDVIVMKVRFFCPPFFSFFNFEYGIHEEENRRIRIQALYFNLCDKSRNMKTVKIVLLVTAFYLMWIV